ncbi:uncharacterized protein LOC121267191 [Juglans microcarpa x Juglans regia]|uniref:uncharacterized protein LOC121267191 n=1 Tax=Juglans microcarpa x Juglans regia TaxID=2249226 RepID=UPI001B7DE4BB|nr:uncharacterized protein LOC121267191 [Juglans microcarpa x Juglans regia]
MAAAGDTSGSMMANSRSFADLLSTAPHPIPDVLLPSRAPKTMDGEVYFLFSKEKIMKSAEPFRFSLVLKFLRQRPSLDATRLFIKNRWGLSGIVVVSAMRKPRNAFVQLTLEEDFNKALSREVFNIDGVAYRSFHWTPEFSEGEELSVVPVWIFLLGLAPNFYHPSIPKSLTTPIGKYIRCDNSTRCATRTDGARVCLELDVAKSPLLSFWIGAPSCPASRMQEVVYKTMPAFCTKCKIQGHNLKTCKKFSLRKEKAKQLVRIEHKEVPKQLKILDPSGSKPKLKEVANMGTKSKISDALVLVSVDQPIVEKDGEEVATF